MRKAEVCAMAKDFLREGPPHPKDEMSAKTKRTLRIVLWGMAVVILCPILVHYGRVWIPRAWGPLCEITEEPTGFGTLAGMDKHVRHAVVQGFNPGTTYPKTTLKVKVTKQDYTAFTIVFRYSCPTCGKLSANQVVTIIKSIHTSG